MKNTDILAAGNSAPTDEQIFSQAEAQIEALHFRKAAAILEAHQNALESTEPWKYAWTMARILLFRRKWKKSRPWLEKAQAAASTPEQKGKTALLQSWLYCERGNFSKARQFLETARGASLQSPDYFMQEALVDVETGQMQKAFEIMEPFCARNEGTLSEQIQANVLLGDICSYLEKPEQAISAYTKAFSIADKLPDGARCIRQALIYNSEADLMESMEKESEAAEYYKLAIDLASQAREDPDLFDSTGYQWEIMLSYINLLLTFGHSIEAGRLLQQQKALLKQLPMPVFEYWQARLEFLYGLMELYEESETLDPLPHFQKALESLERFIQNTDSGCREFMGRICYYSAFCMSEQNESDPLKARALRQKQLDLYARALSLFEENKEKDLKFYLHTLGTIQNDMANLLAADHPKQAMALYQKARESLEQMLARWPEDEFSRSALVNVLLNLADLSQSDPERSSKYNQQALRQVSLLPKDMQQLYEKILPLHLLETETETSHD